MFEDELEMEKKSSSVVPLLLIVGLILAIVGVAGYYIMESRRIMTTAEATDLVTATLKAQGPVMVHFHSGLVKASVDEKPRDPHYRLLEKAGIVKLGKDKEYSTPVSLTPVGEKLLAEIQGVQKEKDKDGTDKYMVPAAYKSLVAITRVTMQSPTRAMVEYTWKWDTNRVGEMFEASGDLVKGFNTWDRSRLIEKYGANFYHKEPSKGALVALRNNNTWQLAPE
jgi:hypothetical protein